MAEASLTFDGHHPMEDKHRKCLAAAGKLKDDFRKARAEKLVTNTKLVTGEVARSENHLIAQVKANIRVPIHYSLAFFFAHHEQYIDQINLDTPEVMLEKYFDRTPRSLFTICRMESPFPLQNREYVAFCAWEKLPDGSFHFGSVSADHSSYPITPDFVRMTVTRSVRLVAISPSLTHVEITSEVNLGGKIPRAINDAITVPQLAGTCLSMMIYFQCVRSPDAYDAGDSTELGKLSFLKLRSSRGRPEELRSVVTKLIARNDAMRAFQAKYNFLDVILCTIVRNTFFKPADEGIPAEAPGGVVEEVDGESDGEVDGEAAGEAEGDTQIRHTDTEGREAAVRASRTFGISTMVTKTAAMLKKSPSGIGSKPLAEFSRHDAAMLASNFKLLLLSNVTGDAAVDQWFCSSPALVELDEEFAWLKPMIEGIAGELLAETPLGAQLRAYSGAFLSVADTASDVYVVNEMLNSDQERLAMALLAMVAANIFLQLVLVYVQNRRVIAKGGNAMLLLRECMYVIFFIKPGVEAWRVASGHEEPVGAAISPLAEMACSKCIELFAEAAPGFVVQSIGFLTSKKKTSAAVLSLMASAGSAAMTSTVLTYDLDTNPASRKQNPDVYGLIPDTGRGAAFSLLFSLAMLQVIARGVSVALLAVTNGSWLQLYLGTDMLLFLMYKTIMGDFLYWLPMPFAAAVPFSLVCRLIVKTVVDFSGCAHFKHPYEMGGAYYCFNAVLTLVSVPVFVYLYKEYAEVEEGGAEKLGDRVLWTFSICILVAWLALFGLFVARTMSPKNRKTLLSTRTGCQRIESLFLHHKEDAKRIQIFGNSMLKWLRIKEDVRAWTLESWETWEAEKPGWFTANQIAKIPDDFIPLRYLVTLGGARERRGSAAVVGKMDVAAEEEVEA
jgi:hypothetical protein